MSKIESEVSLFKETKPKEFRDRIALSVEDSVKKFLGESPEMEFSSCPFCQSADNYSLNFRLSDQTYLRCNTCESLYSSPRPTQEALARFYEMQPAQMVDAEMLPEVRERRIERVMRPRWKKLSQKLKENNVQFPVKKIMEVGAGIGHFIEVMQADKAAERYVAVEPAKACGAQLENLDSTEVVQEILEKIPATYGDCDLLFMNSVIEHPHSLEEFFSCTRNLLKPGGMFVLVDMHSNGLDIEVMRGDAQNVNPFFILQIGSVEGVKRLASRHGFELVDVFSMGQMDMDIFFEFCTDLPTEHPMHGFKYLLNKRELRDDLQEVLRKHKRTGYNGYILKRVG